jgi:aldose 1-epimerase
VVIVEVGGGIRAYTSASRPVLHGFTADEMCSAGRGQVLMPWPNRVRDGRYSFAREQHQLPLTEPARSNAIHGLVRWSRWNGEQLRDDCVNMTYELFPQPGYPFRLSLSIAYRLGADGLHVRTKARNAGDRPCPFGSGAHPYLTLEAPIDECVLSAPGSLVYACDERGIPHEVSSVDGSHYDFRAPRAIGDTVLDHCFTALGRDEHGLARVVLTQPDTGHAVGLWVDEAYDYLMLFTGDPIPAINRSSIAVEPMTCAPDAFRTGDGLLILEPGDVWSGSWGVGPVTPEPVR